MRALTARPDCVAQVANSRRISKLVEACNPSVREPPKLAETSSSRRTSIRLPPLSGATVRAATRKTPGNEQASVPACHQSEDAEAFTTAIQRRSANRPLGGCAKSVTSNAQTMVLPTRRRLSSDMPPSNRRRSDCRSAALVLESMRKAAAVLSDLQGVPGEGGV